jgi:hypothetical protein
MRIGVAFRDAYELIGSPNNGNFLRVLELMSGFDQFLADQISRFGNKAVVFQVICMSATL